MPRTQLNFSSPGMIRQIYLFVSLSIFFISLSPHLPYLCASTTLMADSPERTSKRRRLCEPSDVADSSPPFQPEAFTEAMEWMDSLATDPSQLGHSSSYNLRHTSEDPFEADPTISSEAHSILLENINCEEDSAIHIVEGVETISHDIIDSENETVCFGMVSTCSILKVSKYIYCRLPQ